MKKKQMKIKELSAIIEKVEAIPKKVLAHLE